ncbi:MAG: ShlB/FhaC/HecB family hemolysin secretion/activation protein [Saccharospirillum sp.]
MKKGMFSIVMAATLVVSAESVQAQQGGSFFDNETQTRFETPGLPESTPGSGVEAPALTIRQFVFIDFDQAAASGLALEPLYALTEQDRQDRNGLYNVAALNELVGKLTAYIRDRGYFLARVIVPEQQIRNETVALQLVIGRLEQVTSMNNSHYDDDILTLLFQSQVGEPVQREPLEQALLRLSDYPGIELRTALAPGSEPGTTQMQLDVLDVSPLNASVQFDNHGSEDTGPYRLTLGGQYNNPGGRADRVAGEVRFSLFPANSVSGQISYHLPLESVTSADGMFRNTDLTVGYRASGFRVGGDLEVLEIEGQSRDFYVSTDRTLTRSRTGRTSAFAAVHLKASTIEQDDALLSDYGLTVVQLGGRWSETDTWLGGGFSQLEASLAQGLGDFLGSADGSGDAETGRQGRSGDFAAGTFRVLRLSGERVQAVGGQYLLLKTHVQYSADLLTAMEQYSFGGADTVRGYPRGDRIADSVWGLNVEYYGASDAPFLTLPINRIKLALFWDLALGELNDARPNEVRNPTAMSVGGYTEFRLAQHYQTRLELAVPLGAELPSDGRSFSLGFRISRHF